MNDDRQLRAQDMLLEALPPEQRVLFQIATRVDMLETSLADMTAEVSRLREEVLLVREKGEQSEEEEVPLILGLVDRVVPLDQRVQALDRRIEALEKKKPAAPSRLEKITMTVPIEELPEDVAQALKEKPRRKAHLDKRPRGRKPQGRYCLWCHKTLDASKRNQATFCSPVHAQHWYGANPGTVPYPLMSLDNGGRKSKDAFSATIVAGEGVTKGSVG